MPPIFVPFGGDRKSITSNGFDIPGSFGVNDVDPPVNVRGKGFSVARTGVGEYTVTLTYRIPNIDAVNATVQSGLVGAFTAEVGAQDLAARTLILRTLVAGVPTDIPAGPSNRVNFTIAVGGN